MGEPLPEQVLDTAVDPAEIVRQSFDTERRGFSQQQVQQYLRAVADSLQDAQQREADMRTRLGRAVRRAENAEHALRNAPDHDPADLNRELGDQVASVLEAARVAGEQRMAVAEKSATKLLADAKAESSKMRADAQTVLQERIAEAERAATDVVTGGKADAQQLRDQAKDEAAATVTHAAERIENVRDECDALIREAEEARAQILEDMERRRRQARAQVERLRVGRDRLLRSYEVVRRTLEETTVELKSSLKEAKVRGDSAARAITSEPLASREQLEAELRDAKMIGRITISDPAPTKERLNVAGVLRSPALPRPLDTKGSQAANGDADTPAETTGVTPTGRVSQAMKKGALATNPKAPASAPALKASSVADADEDPIAAMMAAAEEKRVGTAAPVPADLDKVPEDPELAQLEDDDLNVLEPSDDIERVVAMPLAESAGDPSADEPSGEAPGLFDALRAQRNDPKAKDPKAKDPKAKEPKAKRSKAKKSRRSSTKNADAAKTASSPAASVDGDSAPGVDDQAASDMNAEVIPGIEAQRDAVIADAAKQLEKRLKRALADEQNDILAGIRASKKNVALTAIVGDVDAHINRYVLAIHEVAAVTYGAGAALIDVEAAQGHLPAGAVEELLEVDVVTPIRHRLATLDDLGVDAADMHVDPLRAFYRQRKNDYLGPAASRLASLLCVAGLCDALPAEAALPWAAASK